MKLLNQWKGSVDMMKVGLALTKYQESMASLAVLPLYKANMRHTLTVTIEPIYLVISCLCYKVYLHSTLEHKNIYLMRKVGVIVFKRY